MEGLGLSFQLVDELVNKCHHCWIEAGLRTDFLPVFQCDAVKWGEKQKRCSLSRVWLSATHALNSLPGFSVHEILQARILEQAAIPFSRGSSWPSDQTHVSRIAGRFFTVWASREAQAQWTLTQRTWSQQDFGMAPSFTVFNASTFSCRKVWHYLNQRYFKWSISWHGVKVKKIGSNLSWESNTQSLKLYTFFNFWEAHQHDNELYLFVSHTGFLITQ